MSKTTQMKQSAYNQGLVDARNGSVIDVRKCRWYFKGDYVRGVKTYIDQMAKSNPVDRETIISRVECWPKEYYKYLLKANPSLAEWHLHSIELLESRECTIVYEGPEEVVEYSFNDMVSGKVPNITIEQWAGKYYLIAHNYYAMVGGDEDYDFTIHYNASHPGGWDELDGEDTTDEYVVEYKHPLHQ